MKRPNIAVHYRSTSRDRKKIVHRNSFTHERVGRTIHVEGGRLPYRVGRSRYLNLGAAAYAALKGKV